LILYVRELPALFNSLSTPYTKNLLHRLSNKYSPLIIILGVELGILFLVDLDRIKRDPALLGKVLTRARYGRLGSLTIYLVTNGRELREWAESLREGLAKNFDVTVYLYPVANIEKAVKMIISSCRGDDIVTIYKEIPEHHAREISSSCPHIEIT
jgi:hypothetical protein